MGLLWVGYVFWIIQSYDMKKQFAPADAGIVLGAALWRDQPSPALKERLNLALSLYEQGVVDRLILSGGLGGLVSSITEAEGMRNYLTDRGVPEEDLLLEDKASSTYQNLYYSRGLGERENVQSYLLITHDYHAARAGDIADFLDMGDVQVAGVTSQVLSPVYHSLREILAYTKWKLDALSLWSGLRDEASMI
ncbi:YdcF family protein [Paenibacillus chungangensis]|uniref:YdcF family protein n=1 Tax=Paenibacillus chungangensis TaxID=696535 RepID=A0ABW3HN63_9BACL